MNALRNATVAGFAIVREAARPENLQAGLAAVADKAKDIAESAPDAIKQVRERRGHVPALVVPPPPSFIQPARVVALFSDENPRE